MLKISTRKKILVAHFLSFSLINIRRVFGLGTKVKKKKMGIWWNLDLKEGIDLAIYIFGGFELTTLKRYSQLIKEGDIVIDIGSNIGAHTLPLARCVGEYGTVISFEPTEYAFLKQINNLCLTPELYFL